MGYWSDLCAWLFKDPAKLIRYLVLFVCVIVVIVQLYECFTKLRRPPISTHAYYNLNETIEMPAVTICREPPYKADVLSEKTCSTCLHPKYTTCWINYPYGEVELEDFFMEATFAANETFLGQQYGLNGHPENVEIKSSLHFVLGLCHTIVPKQPLKRAGKATGYSMTLTHHVHEDKLDRYPQYENEPGWHIFIHDRGENFTEINTKGSGRVEYVFAEINEEIEVKLQSQYFANVAKRENSCIEDKDYSDLRCGELCTWKALSEVSNCSGPWMRDVDQQPCDNYRSMRNLTTEYGKIYNSDEDTMCDCMQPCESRIFSTYIQNRKSFNQIDPYTQVWIYYTTKLISMVEERPSYDSTQFIADIGGSLGFLLGLSVLGFIGMLEHLLLFFCGSCIHKLQMKHEQRMKSEDDSRRQSERSDGTVDIATIDKEKLSNSKRASETSWP